MKNLTTLFVLLCLACAKPGMDSDKQSITKLIDDETKYAAAADTVKYAQCWVNTDEAHFMIATTDGAQEFKGWNTIRGFFKDAKPFDLKLKRDNYNYIIGRDVAFVSFDQQDNWGGSEERRTRETRTLKKENGQWKIVDVNVIGVSSFDKKITGSFHVSKEKLTVDPRTSIRHQDGLGGMAVGFAEIPTGTDMSPLLAGLPQDMCPSPHWGYLLEGSIKVKYPDGKEDVVNAGEVFYWPAPHTAMVVKNVKLIDFSPETEYAQVMDHIAKKMAEMKK